MLAFLICIDKLAIVFKVCQHPPHVQIIKCSAQALFYWPWFSLARFFVYTLLLQFLAFR
jgi:hypothetical protein